MPLSVMSADFKTSAQILKAARDGDAATVRNLVAAGADINLVDNTGLSVVCTALKNNDRNAVRILQANGADASRCDQQFRNFKGNQPAEEGSGFFSGLSTTQTIVLGTAATAAVVGGVLLIGGGTGGGGGGGGNTPNPNPNPNPNPPVSPATPWTPGALPTGPSGTNFNLDFYSSEVPFSDDFAYMKPFNYLLMMNGYAPMARGYLGMRTIRRGDNSPFPLNEISFGGTPISGGAPVSVALITGHGIDPSGSASRGLLVYGECNASSAGGCTSVIANNSTVTTKYFNDKVTLGGDDNDYNDDTWEEDLSRVAQFDFSGNGTVFNPTAPVSNTSLVKVIGGWFDGNRLPGDLYGFLPNGQMAVFRTGYGEDDKDFYNFKAMLSAAAMNIGTRKMATAIVNGSIVPGMHEASALTMSDAAASASGTPEQNRAAYVFMINSVYKNENDTTLITPGQDAHTLFSAISLPIIVMPAGDYKTGGAAREATFENYAPAIYTTLNHNFMTAVAVSNNTGSFDSVTSYNNAGTNKFSLSTRNDGVTDFTSRRCGIAGKGAGMVDPWCFAAAGNGTEVAAASLGASVGVVASAFDYMTSKQIFVLLALTAEGPYLATNSAGNAMTKAELVNRLRDKYSMPGEYRPVENSGTDDQYLTAFSEVFGYGMVNLERATRPGTRVFFYSGDRLANGNAYWRNGSSATVSRTSINLSGAFGARASSITVPVFDTLRSVDGSMSITRAFDITSDIGVARRGLDFTGIFGSFASGDRTISESHRDMTIKMSLSENSLDSANNAGLSEMSFAYSKDDISAVAQFQHKFTDAPIRGIVRADLSNPLLSLSSNATSFKFEYGGSFKMHARAVSGAVRDEVLLEYDPNLTASNERLKLGGIVGAESGFGYFGKSFAAELSFGTIREDNTVLGGTGEGLFEISGGKSVYADAMLKYSIAENIKFAVRYTAAKTTADFGAGFISDMSAINSDAYGIGAELGKFSVTVSRPLAVSKGYMDYATADYEMSGDDGSYAMNISPRKERLDLSPGHRETRLGFSYTESLGEFTSGSIGFMYRIDPDHSNRFGNESLLMMKLSHRLGI
jgi:hypothetical protein